MSESEDYIPPEVIRAWLRQLLMREAEASVALSKDPTCQTVVVQATPKIPVTEAEDGSLYVDTERLEGDG